MSIWRGRDIYGHVPKLWDMTCDEIRLVSALVQDEAPIICSCCLGSRVTTTFMIGQRRCGQCDGVGFDLIGSRTIEALEGKTK